MKLSKVIKNISKIAKVEQNENFFFAKVNGKIIEFCANGYFEDDNDVVGFIVKDEENDYTDCETNLYSGIICENLKQVMRRVGA